MALLRIAGIAAGALVVWLVVVGQISGQHLWLPVERVVVGAKVSQPFGCTSLELEPFDPFCPGSHIHTGIDLAAPFEPRSNALPPARPARQRLAGASGFAVQSA